MEQDKHPEVREGKSEEQKARFTRSLCEKEKLTVNVSGGIKKCGFWERTLLSGTDRDEEGASLCTPPTFLLHMAFFLTRRYMSVLCNFLK